MIYQLKYISFIQKSQKSNSSKLKFFDEIHKNLINAHLGNEIKPRPCSNENIHQNTIYDIEKIENSCYSLMGFRKSNELRHRSEIGQRTFA